MAAPTRNHCSQLSEFLKELYTGETEAVRLYKAGKLSDLEIVLYEREIKRAERCQGGLKDLVYSINPFLEMIKK
jgi:hypothetical protein